MKSRGWLDATLVRIDAALKDRRRDGWDLDFLKTVRDLMVREDTSTSLTLDQEERLDRILSLSPNSVRSNREGRS